MRYYQINLTYPCDVCGARHVVNRWSEEKIEAKEKNGLMVSGFKALKKDFDIKHPEDKFNVERVLIEETNDIGQVRALPVEKSKIEGILAMVDVTEEKFKKPKKKEEEGEEEVPFEDTGKTGGMSFEDIRNKVEVRIRELQETHKSCREAMEKLGIQLKKTKIETANLQSLLKAINQPKDTGKKNGRKRKRKTKQKPKSK